MTPLFEVGAIFFFIDDHGVGHLHYGQGGTLVNRQRLRAALLEVQDAATKGLETLDAWETEKGKPE